MKGTLMTGGTIKELTKQPDGIVLRIQGVGPLRGKVAMVKIVPTNYRLQPGDLVWWSDDCLRWEGRASKPFVRLSLDGTLAGKELHPADTTF